MSPNKVFIVTLLLSLSTFIVSAQQSILIEPLDKVSLEADEFRGSILWEVSNNNLDWNSIEGATMSPFEITPSQFPTFYRARITEEGCSTPHFSEVIEVNSNTTLKYWSDPTTWGGELPSDDEDVVIDDYIVLDMDTPPLGELTINGTLVFERQDIHLTADNILVNGLLQIGSEAQPFEQIATITLTGTNNTNSASDRGIMVMGNLELHGATPDVLWTRIEGHVTQGATQINLQESVEWDNDGVIVVAPTDYYQAGNGTAITQQFQLTNVDGNALTTSEGSNSHRWGLLQYATPNGLSTDASAERVETPVPNDDDNYTPTILDERAEVGYLTRNIVIESPDDNLWSSVGFGCHIMIMPEAEGHVDGVEIKRGGQRGHIRRYPFHWHNLSYQNLQETGDATGQYLRNSTINASSQRGIVIHGTNGILVQNNIVYNVQGHGIFTEDAVERRNVIDGNLVLMVRNAVWGTQLKNHEIDVNGDSGSSGLWISNPDNTIINNVVADCAGFGYWLAFTTQAWGDQIGLQHSSGYIYRPDRERFGLFEKNVAHTIKFRGIMLDKVESDNDGNVAGNQYYSTSDGRNPSYPFPFLERFTLSEATIYKCGHNAFWDRSTWPNTFGFTVADNCGRSFAGAGAEGRIERNLVIGTSLNHEMNGTGRDELGWTDFYRGQAGETNPGSVPVAFASYHHTFVAKDNVVVEFPLVAGERSGTFDMGDYYIRALEKGQVRNTDNLLINSHPGHKAKAPDNWYTFSSAVWDPHGVWGEPGRFLVDDVPFLTHGKDVEVISPSNEAVGAVSVEGPFYSLRGFVLYGVGDVYPLNQPYFDLWPIHITRLDDTQNEIDTWSVAGSGPSDLFSHMKDVVTSPSGMYEVTFPSQDNPTNYSMLVDNMLETSDTQVVGIQFDGSITNILVGMEAYGNREYYTEVNSLEEVLNSSGATFWQDETNNRLWAKLRGGIWAYYTDNFDNDPPPSFEDTTYEQLSFFIRPQ